MIDPMPSKDGAWTEAKNISAQRYHNTVIYERLECSFRTYMLAIYMHHAVSSCQVPTLTPGICGISAFSLRCRKPIKAARFLPRSSLEGHLPSV